MKRITLRFFPIFVSLFLAFSFANTNVIAQPTAGDLLWYTFTGGLSNDLGADIIMDSQGFIYMIGNSSSSWGSPQRAFSGETDVCVARYNRHGFLTGNTFLGGTGKDRGDRNDDNLFRNSIALDSDGNIYVIGCSDVAWGDVSPYPANNINPNNPDAFIAKLDNELNLLWHKFYGGGSIDEAHGICLDQNGNIYVTGNTMEAWNTDADAFLLKMDSNGNILWERFFGTDNADVGFGVTVSPSNKILTTGLSTFPYTNYKWLSGNPVRTGSGYCDAYVAEFSGDGTLEWYTFLGGDNQTTGYYDYGRGIIADNNYVYVAGGSEVNWGSPIQPCTYGVDAFVAKLDIGDGSLIWNTFLGGKMADAGRDIALDRYGNLYVTGQDFHAPEEGGELGAFACMLDNNGNQLWYKFLGIPGPTYGQGLFAQRNGVICLVGESQYSWNPDSYGIPIHSHTETGANDIFVAELSTGLGMPVVTMEDNIVLVDHGDIASNTVHITDPDDDQVTVISDLGNFEENDDGTCRWSCDTEPLVVGRYFVNFVVNDGNGGIVDNSFVLHVGRVPTQDEIQTRIGSGLDWLISQQKEDGSWNGPYHVIIIDEPVACTGFALTKLCSYAFENGHSPFDEDFPYFQNVIDGFSYLFSQAHTNGEGTGIYIHADLVDPYQEDYNTAAAMMAIASTYYPERVIISDNSLVNGKTFMQLMNELVTYFTYHQVSGESDPLYGSWGNSSITGYIAFALHYAEAFGCEIPPEVKEKLSVWIDFIQNDNSGGAGFTAPDDDWPPQMKMMNTANTLIQMAFAGDNLGDIRVQKALEFIKYLWVNRNLDAQWNERNIELLYCLMKALNGFGIETLQPENSEFINWYEAFSTHLLFFSISDPEGFWIFSWGGDRLLNTCWALLTLEKDVPEFSNQEPQLIADHIEIIVDEGQTAVNTGTVIDPDGDEVTLSASAGAVVNNNNGTWWWSFITCDGPAESQTIILTADDGNGGVEQITFKLIVNNVAPSIEALLLPPDPVALDFQLISIRTEFTDPAGSNDATYTCTVDFGDESGKKIGSSPGNNWSCSHTYAETGVYKITVTITDKDGDSGTLTSPGYIVIYDPSAGFVTGGGWISSPSGAYIPDETLSGKASFGFVSKYTKNKTTPDGKTEFQFHAAGMNFHSSSYEWLIIAGAKAILKGEGTINGLGRYGFQLTAIDADLTPISGVDLLRIHIWDKNNGDALIYDNKVGETDPFADPAMTIGGGSIKIHSTKLKCVTAESGIDDLWGDWLDGISFSVYPNPFNQKVYVQYLLTEDIFVSVKVYNVLGENISILVDGYKAAGIYNCEFDAAALPDGLYFCKLSFANNTFTKKIVSKR